MGVGELGGVEEVGVGVGGEEGRKGKERKGKNVPLETVIPALSGVLLYAIDPNSVVRSCARSHSGRNTHGNGSGRDGMEE